MENTECCGMHVVKFAKILSIIGIVTNIIYGNFISAGIFAAVLYGIENQKSAWLYPAIIFLGICIIGITLALIGFTIFIAFAMTQSPVFGIFIVAIIFIAVIDFFHIFALIAINRARKYLLESTNRYPPPIPSSSSSGYPQTNPSVYPQTATNLPSSNYPPPSYPTYSLPSNTNDYSTQPSAPQYPNYPY